MNDVDKTLVKCKKLKMHISSKMHKGNYAVCPLVCVLTNLKGKIQVGS